MATPIAPPGRKRLVHQLDTPFSTVRWPEISSDDQDTILELLCNLLSPIGQHRRTHIKPSRGKRAAKRESKGPTKEATATVSNAVKPPKPAICDYVDVGFNAITREFESFSNSETAEKPDSSNSRQTYSMLFVLRGDQSPAFNCHFPKMVAATSKKLGPQHDIKLVGFSKSCSDRLSSCLEIVRVSSIAIARNAPGSEALWTFVKEHVPSVDAAWLDMPNDSAYKPTQIASVETFIGVKRSKTAQVT